MIIYFIKKEYEYRAKRLYEKKEKERINKIKRALYKIDIFDEIHLNDILTEFL